MIGRLARQLRHDLGRKRFARSMKFMRVFAADFAQFVFPARFQVFIQVVVSPSFSMSFLLYRAKYRIRRAESHVK